MEYRGHTIDKYYNNQLVPNHVIRQYYQEQKARIDRIIEIENRKENHTNTKTISEDIDDFLREMEE